MNIDASVVVKTWTGIHIDASIFNSYIDASIHHIDASICHIDDNISDLISHTHLYGV